MRGRGGGDRGGGRGFGGGGGRGFGGRGGGGGGFRDEGPPDTVIVLGIFQHACEGDLIVKHGTDKVPYFNAPIYLENKSQVGKVDEIFGPVTDALCSVKPSSGIEASSFKNGDKLYINPEKLLPLQRFLPQPKGAGAGRGGGRGAGRGGGRGAGRGGPGGRGAGGRGGGRGGFSPGGRGGARGGGRGFSPGGRGRGRG
jgi:H/ACA ribonucleoprotein complex subunit 1